MSRSPLLLPIVVGVLLLSAVAAVFFLMRPSGDASTPSTSPSVSASASASPEDPVEPDKQQVLLVADGWSLAIAGSNEAVVVDAVGDRDTVTFVPVDETTLPRVLESAPQALVPLLARMFPMTDTVECAAGGCVVGKDPVTLEQLRDASTVPTLGASYAGWQVPAVVYVAESAVAPDAPFEVSIGGADAVVLNAPVSSPEVLDGPDIDREALARDPFFGFAAGVYPVATAFARTFVPEAVWVDSRFPPRFTPVDGVAPSLSVLEEIAAAEPLPFLNGLNAPEPSVGAFDGSALTWLSSPSSGCGPGVICTPRPVDYTVDSASVAVQVEKVCSPDGDSGVIIRDALVDITYPYPTHQTGAWYQYSADVKPLSDNPAAVSFWKGTPALAEGDVTLRVTTGAYYVGETESTPDLVRFTGRSSMPGFDQDADEPLSAWVERNFSPARNQLICTGS